MVSIIPQNPGHDDTDICNTRKTSDFDMEILIDTHIHDVEINIAAVLFRRFFPSYTSYFPGYNYRQKHGNEKRCLYLFPESM